MERTPMTSEWGGLQVATVGPRGASETPIEKGGLAVVLLHGWGAPGDDLVPFAQALVRPGTRFFVPAAPLPSIGGGRAWWHLDARDRPAHAWDDETPVGHTPHPQLKNVREAILTVVRTIRERHAPTALAIAGFSQGAMLSLDVALTEEAAVDRVAALSGLMLADSLPALRAPRTRRPAVFLSHGRQDQVVPFEASERAKELLERHGHAVTWHPFTGGHEIPPAVVEDLRKFLFG